ncbi:Uncharacterized protein FWK35_00021693 [Aphis craccivora]|uniref:Uncharacterized protein n=1 Tax=Aphis craccivora TaxID=307492 RepID=A0A6G0WY95_APHCR|nr:Uncharacterized protein FWK35_00021693 [Aphis craccivora]
MDSSNGYSNFIEQYQQPFTHFRQIDIITISSEQSDECIDFTMMCVCFFFVSVYSITSVNNAPISNYGGGFRCKEEYPWCIIEVKS